MSSHNIFCKSGNQQNWTIICVLDKIPGLIGTKSLGPWTNPWVFNNFGGIKIVNLESGFVKRCKRFSPNLTDKNYIKFTLKDSKPTKLAHSTALF